MEIGLDRKFLVERKGSLNEVAGNLTKDRERFIEFERVGDKHMHMAEKLDLDISLPLIQTHIWLHS